MTIEHLVRGDIVELPLAEFKRLEATLEFLQDEAVQKEVLAGVAEHRRGRSRAWSDVREEI